MKKIISSLLVLITSLFFVPSAFAHVTVKPAELGVGVRSNFVMSVPTEEDVPTTQVRLVIPEGLRSVRPNVAPGWNIQIVKTGEGENVRVSEIIWSGGSIGVDMRNEFVFSAQAPADEASLNWKAYQTYANGLVVSWDTDPKAVEEYSKANPVPTGMHDDNAPKPYSITKVLNDLAASPVSTLQTEAKEKESETFSLPMVLSIAAILLAGTSLYLQMKSKKK